MLKKPVSQEDFHRLLDAVVLAKALSGNVVRDEGNVVNHEASYYDPQFGQDTKLCAQEVIAPTARHDAVRRKDIEAQLRAMSKIRDDGKLMGALWNCDRLTFEAIQQASFSIMSDLLFENGHFIDADGETWQSPSEIQLGLHESDSPYLPLGVAGLREAIAKALDEIADKKDLPGAREKPYQIELAKVCNSLWKKYVDPAPKPHASPRTGKGSPDVTFAVAVFSAAGMPLSPARVRDVLKKAN